jgi:CTP synthase
VLFVWYSVAKYLFVTGGVMSGIGKGITTASIGRILQTRGISVTAMKIDPYLNFDAGTMNPIAHGEVFVTDDGGEIDMDLGTYERFLDMDLTREHNATTGQIYMSVFNKERHGDLLGQCVQIIPHVTDEIKSRIRAVAVKTGAEVTLVEVGGTVGDIESLPFLEAARQMRLEHGTVSVGFVHVTLVPVLDVVGEQKTKPTQHSVQELRRIGIQPDIIVCRSKTRIQTVPKKKIALFCNVEERAVFTSQDVASVYEIPVQLDDEGLGEYLTERFALAPRSPDWNSWKGMLGGFVEPEHEVRIAICGKYAELADSYVSVNEALRHAGAACSANVRLHWIETEEFESDPDKVSVLGNFDGVLVPGGFGSRGTEGKIRAVNYARMKSKPFLGICFGFQLAVVEFARGLGMRDANSTEINPKTTSPVIDLMPEQRNVEDKGATMRLGGHDITVKPGTMAHRLYGSAAIRERHRHRYEVSSDYIERITAAGGLFSAWSDNQRRMEIFEIPSHYYFLATQFHAEFKSRPGRPSPPYFGFVRASLDKKLGKSEIELPSLVKATLR